MPTTTTHFKITWLDGTSEELTTTSPVATDDAERLVFTDTAGHKQEINKKATRKIESWTT